MGSALKNSTRVLAKNWSHSAAQERPSKPKRRLLDFNEFDESIEEENELDAELSRLLTNSVLAIHNCLQVQKRASSG